MLCFPSLEIASYCITWRRKTVQHSGDVKCAKDVPGRSKECVEIMVFFYMPNVAS